MLVCVSLYVVDREGSQVFASTALEVVWMAMHLTGHSDYLTGFYEPLLPPYRCHAGLWNVLCGHWLGQACFGGHVFKKKICQQLSRYLLLHACVRTVRRSCELFTLSEQGCWMQRWWVLHQRCASTTTFTRSLLSPSQTHCQMESTSTTSIHTRLLDWSTCRLGRTLFCLIFFPNGAYAG